MNINAYKTSRVNVGDNLCDIIQGAISFLEENSILAVTSKVVSLCEGNVVSKSSHVSKYELIKSEADAILSNEKSEAIQNNYEFYLTIKDNILIPSAGIDESNGEDVYILYPRDIQKSAAEIWRFLRNKYQVKNIGVIITDSHTTPLRRGVTGIAIGYCGFKALYSYIGTPDLFGHPLRVTKINNLDALASSAVYVMGEGAEQTPLATITNIPRMEFQDCEPTEEEIAEIRIPLEMDLYGPVLSQAKWVWKK